MSSRPAPRVRAVRLEDGRWRVEVDEGGRRTVLAVREPGPAARSLGLPAVDEERLVVASVEFLLEREPASSILPEFGLETIARYFPEYVRVLCERLGPRGN
jgi:hypothetical protein